MTTITVDASESSQQVTVSNNYVTGTVLFQYVDVKVNDDKYRVDFKLDVYRDRDGCIWIADYTDLDYIRDVFIVKDDGWVEIDEPGPLYNTLLTAAVYEVHGLSESIIGALNEERSALIVEERNKAKARVEALDALLPDDDA